MWKQVKALVEPLERVMTLGVKGSKANATGGTSIFAKQQVSEIQKQFSNVNIYNNSVKTQEVRLRDFIFENFAIFKSFIPLPEPVPITFSRTPLRICKPQRIGLTSNYAFSQSVGTRNMFCNSGARNFSSAQTAVFNNSFNNGGVVLAKLGFKPFSALATKTGALWTPSPDNLGKNVNPSEFVGLKIDVGRKLFQSKGIFDAVQKQESDEHKHNKPLIVRRTNIKKSSRKNKTVAKTMETTENSSDVQVYMSFILSPPLFWENSISMESSFSSINSFAGVVSHLMRNVSMHQMDRLDPLFIENLQEHAEIQYNHMMEVISILKILQTHGGYEIKVFDCELRVIFPRGMTVVEVEDLLQSSGIDLESPHFELEVFHFGGDITLSPPSDEIDVHQDFQFPDPGDSFLYLRDSHPSISPASPLHIPSTGTMSYISAPPSPCMSIQQSPRHGQEYFSGIEEFLTHVDDFSDKSAAFGARRGSSEISDSDIGEGYFEV
ncbi:11962_t:CDS:1 [Acaulospora colombiana]|uniref:11962_t:CDS:1 n=1 Tax=Acaulospora colombiana TaxID=27376 RepID=A0ACA9M043_9GLOM|nr:11962_t:CDS:1 [Acaulospora colombiana]